MLDEIMKTAMEALSLTSAQVDAAQQALLTELASDDARAAALDAKWHPDGSTTRLENAVPRAQKTYSDRRDDLVKLAPKFIALMIAAQVARQRLEDAEKMLQLKWKANGSAGSAGVPKEVAEWYPRLERHGVKRSFLGEFSNETIAIIADLIRWKARDARFRDADNPWRAILGIYAERVIVVPARKFTSTLSVSGTPTPPRHVSSDRHYMFNEMYRDLPVPRVQPAEPTRPIIDCSVYPEASQPQQSPIDVAPPADFAPSDDAPPVMLSSDDVDDEEVAMAPIAASDDMIISWATRIVDELPFMMGIFWPDHGVERDDYDVTKLVPALEKWALEKVDWSHPQRFLEAAREGRAREFMSDVRLHQIELVSKDLNARDPAMVERALRLGIVVP